MGGQRYIKKAMVCEFVSILTQVSSYLLLLSTIVNKGILPSYSSTPSTPISAKTTSLSLTAVVGQVSVVLRPDRRLRGVLYVAVNYTTNLRHSSHDLAV